MSAIMISFDYNRRVAVGDKAFADNEFRAEYLLNPDGDHNLTADYGLLRMTITGDSDKVGDMKLSEIEKWVAKAVADMIASERQPHGK